MTLERFSIAIIIIAFLSAEAWQPTQLRPKKDSTTSLVVTAQDEGQFGWKTRLGVDLLGDLPRIEALPLGNVDAVLSASRPVSPTGKLRFPISRNADVQIVGWFADSQSQKPGAAVFSIIDGRRFGNSDLTYGLTRPDVGRFYQAPALDRTGFVLRLPAGSFNRGRHSVEFGVVSTDRRGFFLAPQTLTLDASR